MPRNLRAHENARRAKARRQGALERNELRSQSTPRTSAVGATSAPIKVADASDAALIEQFLAKREGK